MELVHSKIYFNFVEKYFQAMLNGIKSVYSTQKQRSVIKFLVAEKCKPCEIYRRMCDAYGEACFSHKKITNEIKMSLLLWVIRQNM